MSINTLKLKEAESTIELTTRVHAAHTGATKSVDNAHWPSSVAWVNNAGIYIRNTPFTLKKVTSGKSAVFVPLRHRLEGLDTWLAHSTWLYLWQAKVSTLRKGEVHRCALLAVYNNYSCQKSVSLESTRKCIPAYLWNSLKEQVLFFRTIPKMNNHKLSQWAILHPCQFQIKRTCCFQKLLCALKIPLR